MSAPSYDTGGSSETRHRPGDQGKTPSRQDEDNPAVPGKEKHPHVLIVEDNEDARSLMKLLLKDRYEVTVASDAAEALDRARQEHFDAFLIDIHLAGGTNGTDLQRKLREMPAYRDTPMAAVTAYALPGDRDNLLQAGFDAYLSKPFTAEELTTLVSNLLSHPGA